MPLEHGVDSRDREWTRNSRHREEPMPPCDHLSGQDSPGPRNSRHREEPMPRTIARSGSATATARNSRHREEPMPLVRAALMEGIWDLATAATGKNRCHHRVTPMSDPTRSSQQPPQGRTDATCCWRRHRCPDRGARNSRHREEPMPLDPDAIDSTVARSRNSRHREEPMPPDARWQRRRILMSSQQPPQGRTDATQPPREAAPASATRNSRHREEPMPQVCDGALAFGQRSQQPPQGRTDATVRSMSPAVWNGNLATAATGKNRCHGPWTKRS